MLRYKLAKKGLSVNLPQTPEEWEKFKKAIKIISKSKENL